MMVSYFLSRLYMHPLFSMSVEPNFVFRLIEPIEDPRAGKFFAQISLEFQRGTAASLLRTLPRSDELSEVFIFSLYFLDAFL